MSNGHHVLLLSAAKASCRHLPLLGHCLWAEGNTKGEGLNQRLCFNPSIAGVVRRSSRLSSPRRACSDWSRVTVSRSSSRWRRRQCMQEKGLIRGPTVPTLRRSARVQGVRKKRRCRSYSLLCRRLGGRSDLGPPLPIFLCLGERLRMEHLLQRITN